MKEYNVVLRIDYMIVKGFFDGLRPEPRITVSEWADQYRFLSSTSSAEPGPYRTARTPFLREMIDNLSANNPIQEIVFMKSAQTGGTEGGFNWIGYIIDLAPAPTLMVQPTDTMSKRNSKMRLDPMIDATPRLREKIPLARSRDSGNTTLQKDFPGGVLVMTGANSAVGLRSMPVRNLMLDEVDGYPADLDGEGSPVDLARARTRTFSKKKIFIVSTPTLEGASVVEQEFEDSDQRRYFVPCPHCDHLQHLKFENLRWEAGVPESVLYHCEDCGAGIEERNKTNMLKEKGYGGTAEWIATNPGYKNKLKVGYHINALYSPLGWYSWQQVVIDYEKAEGDVPKMKTFVNTVLGKTYREQGEAPAWENLYNRRSGYKLNKPKDEVMFITVGVDVQKDRLELEVVGWCRRKIQYSLDYRTIEGDTSEEDVWEELAKVVEETWEREDGMILPMLMMSVDSGYNTQNVYNFCNRFTGNRVIPIKGMDKQQIMVTPPRQVHITKAGKKVGKTKLWHVGVSIIKSEIYGFLRAEKSEEKGIPKGYCYFPQYDEVYFRGLTAEQLQLKKNTKGYNEYVWVKKYARNEPLDCRVYARAAAYVAGMDRNEENEKWWENIIPVKRSSPKKEDRSSGRKRREREDSIW